METKANEILHEKGFLFNIKPKQIEIISSVLEKRDTFAVLPTGYGKSVCYVLPPLILDLEDPGNKHTSLIISPLKSLIKEQVTTLKNHNIKAYGIFEGTEQTDLDAISSGNATVLFASPEAIMRRHWKTTLEEKYSAQLCMVAYDEAHCISEWGLEFREDYRKVGVLQSILDCPVLTLTATCTPEILSDITKTLGLGDARMVSSLPDRQNITICVTRCKQKHEKELVWLVDGIKEKRRDLKKTVVYVNSVEMCERLYIWMHTLLKSVAYDGDTDVNNRLIEMFHAHTDKVSKDRILNSFRLANGSVRILIATVAVGMGMDIEDVSCVIVWGLPPSLLQLWQQLGRAGRGGQQALAVCYAYPRSIANPCNVCRKSGCRKCSCSARKYLRELVDTSECQRVYCLRFFSINEDNKTELNSLKPKSCDLQCTRPCACPMCICCFVCMLSCKCSKRNQSLSDKILNHMNTER